MNRESAGHPFILFNDDTCSLRFVDEPHTEQAIGIALRHLIDTHVRGLCWCMSAGDIAYSWPSKVIENYYDRIKAMRELALDSDVSPKAAEGTHDRLHVGENTRDLILTLHRRGIDYLPILINQAREAGLKFYGTFRMNDTHHRSTPQGLFASRFWQEHQHFRLWDVTEGKTYYNAALNYAHAEVRKRRLDPILEAIGLYDMDGVELDFCRNPFLFLRSEGWESRHLLTELIRNVRQCLDETARTRGRKLDLIVRVPFDEQRRREAGMDVDAWIDHRLMDILVMACPLNDYDQVLSPWVEKCRAQEIGFYPSIEIGPAHHAAHNHMTTETVDETIRRHRAIAQQYYGQGAAGVYMFNYPCILFETRRSAPERERLGNALRELGSARTIAGKPKQYVYWTALPIQLESHRPAEYYQTIHFKLFDSDLSRADAMVRISFRQTTSANPHVDPTRGDQRQDILPAGWVTYWLNGAQVPPQWITSEVQGEGTIASGFRLGSHEKVTITAPAATLRQGENRIGFFIPRFPKEHDPYVNIYELTIDVNL